MFQRPKQGRFDTSETDEAWSEPGLQQPSMATTPLTPEERRYRLNQLLERRRAALDSLRNIGPSVGQTANQRDLRASLIGERRGLEEQIRPLDALEAASRPTLAPDDPRAIAGRQSLAQQAAAILRDRGMQPPAQPQSVKGPDDFADDAKMRSLGLNPASDTDRSRFLEMARLSGRPVREPAAPVATVQGPGSSPTAEQIFDEFQENARRSSELQPQERAAKAARVSAANYAASQQEMVRKQNESDARRVQAAAIAKEENARKAEDVDRRLKEEEILLRQAERGLVPRKGEAQAKAIEAGAESAKAKAASDIALSNAQQYQINEQIKQAKANGELNDSSPEFITAKNAVAELPALIEAVNRSGEAFVDETTMRRLEEVGRQLDASLSRLTPRQRALFSAQLAMMPELQSVRKLDTTMLLGIPGAISKIYTNAKTLIGANEVSFKSPARLRQQSEIMRKHRGYAPPE